MEIFGETFRVVGVESQRLILRGLRARPRPSGPSTDLSNEAQH